MKKGTAYFALLLVLVVAIAVLSIAIVRRRASETPEPTVADVPATAPPVEPTRLPTAAPVQTEAPVQPTEPPVIVTRPPVETPAPTPVPTPTPTPQPQIIASGSFSSATGTGLNAKVDWHIYADASGRQTLQADVSAVSYSFFTDALYQAVVLTVGGSTYSANSPSVRYNGDALTATPIASFTVPVPASGTPISLVWHYRGTYSGKELEDITAESVIYY